MHRRATRTHIPKRAHARGSNKNVTYNKGDISSHKDASDGQPVSRSPERDHEQTEQYRAQPPVKTLKLDDEDNSGAEASGEGSTDADADSASPQLASGPSDDLPTPGPSPQLAAKRLKPEDEDNSEAQASSRPSTGGDADTDSASNQLASRSSDDALHSSVEDDSDFESPPGFVQCGYLQSMTDTSDIIHLRMNLRKGEFQLLRLGKADVCEIYLEGPEIALWHCVIRLVLSVSDDGPVVRQVLVRGLETVPEAQTMASILSGGDTFPLEPEFFELKQGDLICFGHGPWFRLWKAEFHQLYHQIDTVNNDPSANSTVARFRRGHDGAVCVVKTITADRAGMALTELSAYADLGDNSNIVRILECFYSATFHDYHLVLEAATTDLSRFVNRIRHRGQADLRTAASVWTKAMTSAVHHLHTLGMSHRDMKPSNHQENVISHGGATILRVSAALEPETAVRGHLSLETRVSATSYDRALETTHSIYRRTETPFSGRRHCLSASPGEFRISASLNPAKPLPCGCS